VALALAPGLAQGAAFHQDCLASGSEKFYSPVCGPLMCSKGPWFRKAQLTNAPVHELPAPAVQP
jgi:hypothetical protein